MGYGWLIKAALVLAAVLAVAALLRTAKASYDAKVRAPVELERDQAKRELASCQANRQELEKQIATQNGAIKTLETEARERAERSARAAEAAKVLAEKNYRAAQQLLQSAPLDPDVCVSARKRATLYLEGRVRP
jgi:septal ring factor EnvC (AmiA/AmiB activator)